VRTRRFIWFMISIFAGLAVGLVYGWVINPGNYDNTSPDSLRVDYKTDMVLMVAEIYQREGDAAAAAQRLDEIEDLPPVRQVQQAILNGQELGYARADIESLARLFQGLQDWSPTTQEAAP
jgi:hypothetical protein